MSDYANIEAELKNAYLYIGQLEAGIGAAAPYIVPVNKDVPFCSGTGIVGSTVDCTMGNWYGAPTTYSYQFMNGSSPLGTASETASYTVLPADVGAQIACVVTATNATGSTAAPISNAVEGLPAAARAAPATAEHDAHADARREPAHAAAAHAPAANRSR
jgi:hypothetical protein